MQVTFDWSYGVTPDEEGGFIAGCEALGVYAFGDTEAQAVEMLRGTLNLYLQNAWEDGSFVDILHKAGVVPDFQQNLVRDRGVTPLEKARRKVG
ncbi:MAG: type II toxin-antitoxin system HicB family antitoxin [Magnetococcus sp. WYHC-3]